MTLRYFVGIDIAKETLDWAVYTQQDGILFTTHADNTVKAIKATLAQLKQLPDWYQTDAVFCMEHTGIYNAHLLETLHQQGLSIWLESALRALSSCMVVQGFLIETARIG